ncbi:hypothetical protein V2J09_004362 [Rumex salicifolius]
MKKERLKDLLSLKFLRDERAEDMGVRPTPQGRDNDAGKTLSSSPVPLPILTNYALGAESSPLAKWFSSSLACLTRLLSTEISLIGIVANPVRSVRVADQMKPEDSRSDITASQNPAEVNALRGENPDVSEPLSCTTQSALLTGDLSVGLNLENRDTQTDSFRLTISKHDLRDVKNENCNKSSSVTSDISVEKSNVQYNDSLWMEKEVNPEIKLNQKVSSARCSDEDTEERSVFDDPTDVGIWFPPSAENEDILDMLGDEVDENDKGDDEDDNESVDGVKWGKISSLHSIKQDVNREPTLLGSKFKEKKEKEMKDLKNGKFRILVSQLLETIGIANLEKEGESWADIVSPLAWEAALIVKPEAADAKAMDPTGYVKVKCVATGSRSGRCAYGLSRLSVNALLLVDHLWQRYIIPCFSQEKLCCLSLRI